MFKHGDRVKIITTHFRDELPIDTTGVITHNGNGAFPWKFAPDNPNLSFMPVRENEIEEI